MPVRPNKGGQSGGGGSNVPSGAILPGPYTFKKNTTTGRLELWKDDKRIQDQDETGAWIAMGVTTGTGSLHIGDLHSNGSGGENVVWANTDSDIAYYPAWAGVSIDGSNTISATVREHGSLTTGEPNGTVVNGTSVNYNASFTSPSDLAFFYIEVISAENFTGRLLWKAVKSTGKEVAAFYFDASATVGNTLKIPFKYPIWAKAGQVFTVSLTKDDGSFLRVRAGSSNNSVPYRKTFYRPYVDYAVHHEGNPSAVARGLESLTGSNRLDILSLKNADQLTSGGYVGAINFAGNLSQFAGAQRNQYWKAETDGTIGGLSFNIGDKLVCKQNVTGTPSSLTDTNFWAREANLNGIASSTRAGIVRIGDGISVAGDGNISANIGAGLTLDANKRIVTDNGNIDIFTLKNVALLNKGNYRGDVPTTASSLSGAAKGDWWKASTSRTLLGTTFATGDELYCIAAQSGTPTDLTNFLKVANVQSAMIGANGTAAGVTGMVPSPAATDNNKALFGDATFKTVLQPTDVINTLVGTATDKPLSAAQGKALKDTIDALVPNATPLADGTAAIGSSARFARQDHVHPITPNATTTTNGLMSSSDKAKLDGFSPFNTTIATSLGASALAGTSTVPARVDHVHPMPANATTTAAGLMSSSDKTKLDNLQPYAKCGLDFTTSTNPTRVFRDYIWCSAASNSSVSAANVPWIVANQTDADRLAAYWLQQISIFFKDLENDNQYDQLIGGIPSASGISAKLASGSFAAAPSSTTDMDNSVGITGGATQNYAAEWFELIVGANAAGSEIYTMWVNIALITNGTAANTVADVMYPFRMVYQTTSNQNLTSFPTTTVTAISGSAPRTTVRAATWTPSSPSAFLLCAEPISIECRR